MINKVRRTATGHPETVAGGHGIGDGMMSKLANAMSGGARALRTCISLAAFGVLGISPALAQDDKPAEHDGQELKTCIECHEAFFAIADSKHFVQGDSRTPRGAGEECVACHGDTSQHNRTPRKKGLVPVTFGAKAPAGPQNEKCLACHQTGARIHWQGGSHDRAKMACANCHKAHVAKDPVLVAETQPGVCFECHKDKRAETLKLSSHALKSGFMGCSSCHQPHGSTSRALMQKNTVNDTCYTCHADKRGPFLWEHRPAVDDCTNCHNPHGTNNPPMLKVRQPQLCQNCHQSVNHSTIAVSGNQISPSNLTGSAFTNSLTNAMAVGRSCANCHMKVHGTNHPSGARLQR